jgi:hypothetical protein
MISAFKMGEDNTYEGVLNALQAVERGIREAVEERITVVKA